MEADRLLCDDGRMLPWRPTARKIQRDRRVEGWTATGQDAGSHIRQGSRGSVLALLTSPQAQQQLEYRFKGILGARKSTVIHFRSAVRLSQ